MKIKIDDEGIGFGLWNHRVIEHPDGDGVVLIIHEVFYDENGFVEGWDEGGASVIGDDVAGLRETLARMERAIANGILRIKKLDDGHEILVDENGERARGPGVKDLSPEKRRELEKMKQAIEDEAGDDDIKH